MTTPRFLIAKYAPDLRRMEPRNFGVLVWNEGIIKSKFVQDRANGLRRLHLNDPDAYRQWLTFWDMQCQRPTIKRDDGTLATRESPEFVDALMSTASGHFMLSEGGRMMDRVPKEETGDLLNELYSTLVFDSDGADEPVEYSEAELLSRAMPKILKRSGITERPGYRDGYDWICPVGDTMQPFHFDHGIHTDAPKAVIQKVHLLRQATVHHAAFMFEAMQRTYLAHDQCASLVYATPSDLKNDDARAAYRLLKSLGRVVNVADEGASTESLKTFALGV
ncbi:MAG: hypothetical protein SH850_22535 [Planctomycetaceae bacterium]|nr:hypothetical protein [Planctomycetaceae bacterium]